MHAVRKPGRAADSAETAFFAALALLRDPLAEFLPSLLRVRFVHTLHLQEPAPVGMVRVDGHVAVAGPVLADGRERVLSRPEPVRENDHRERPIPLGVVDSNDQIRLSLIVTNGHGPFAFNRERTRVTGVADGFGHLRLIGGSGREHSHEK